MEERESITLNMKCTSSWLHCVHRCFQRSSYTSSTECCPCPLHTWYACCSCCSTVQFCCN